MCIRVKDRFIYAVVKIYLGSKTQFEVYIVKIYNDANEQIFKINDPEVATQIIENVGRKDKIHIICTNNPDGIASFNTSLENSVEQEINAQITQLKNISKEAFIVPKVKTDAQ